MKKILFYLSVMITLLVIVTSCYFHFQKLDVVPYGFHVDELAGAVTTGCLATEGTDAHRIAYPLFGEQNFGTPKPPTYLYPAMLWAKIFGSSVPSLRAFTVAGHWAGIVGLFFLARLLFGPRYALLTVLAGAISPAAWILSRFGLESLFAPTFLIWGLYFFFRSNKIWSMALAGFFFSAAMYSYPPTRLQVPLMLLTLSAFAYQRKSLKLSSLAVFFTSLILVSIPLIQKTLSGHLQERFNNISIFSPIYLKSIGKTNSLKDLAEIFLNNYFSHFRPDFLFTTGDASFALSTHRFGVLSWLDMMGLGILTLCIMLLFFKKFRASHPLLQERWFILFLVVNILIGIIPAALTNEGVPHSMRSIGSWPFVCLLTGFFLWIACERVWPLLFVVALTSALFLGAFLKVYFTEYPQSSKGMFSYWTLEEANSLKTDEDWMSFLIRYRHDDYHVRYFLMQYKHMGCSQTKTIWDNVRDLLKEQGKY